MTRASIVHIGINKSDGFLGPIFGDGRFKFVPIRENFPSENSWTYKELRLQEHVPSTWIYAHYDPEFRTFTWGDFKNKRTFCSRQPSKGDFTFFLASLAYSSLEKVARKPWVENYAMYVIGYFELEEIPKKADIPYPIPSAIKERYANNAHVRRNFTQEELAPFLIFKGSPRSRPLDFAVPFSSGSKPNALAKKAIPDLDPDRPRWWSDAIIDENGVRAIFDGIAHAF